jgi:hypothetical protein
MTEDDAKIVLILDSNLCKSIIHNTLMDYKEDLVTKDEAIDRIFNSFVEYIGISRGKSPYIK